MQVSNSKGFETSERQLVANLFWQAFSGKLGKFMFPENKAIRFFAETVDPDYAIVARDMTGQTLGLSAIKTRTGGLTTGNMSVLAQLYG